MTRTMLMSMAAAAALMGAPALAQTTPSTQPDPAMQTPAGDPAAQPMDSTTQPATAPDPNMPAGDPSMQQQPSGQPMAEPMQSPSGAQPMQQPAPSQSSGQMDSTQSMSQPAPGAMASGGMAGGGNTPADQRGFAPQPPSGATEEQVVQGDGQLETQTMAEGAGQRMVTSNTPVPNPPAGVNSRSPGRGGGR